MPRYYVNIHCHVTEGLPEVGTSDRICAVPVEATSKLEAIVQLSEALESLINTRRITKSAAVESAAIERETRVGVGPGEPDPALGAP